MSEQNFYVTRAKVHANRGTDDGQSDEYPFAMEISSNRLDSYYTHMALDSLDNFRKDAGTGDGVGILEGHRSDTLPIGRTEKATRDDVADNEMESGRRERVVADSYILRGMDLNNLTYASTDGVIRAIDRGVLIDVSVGFYDALFRCDICRLDVFDWSREDYCRHWPGRKYEIDGEMVMCTATIEGARLAEVSIVYSGATPEAGIIRKARAFFERGEIDERAVHGLNQLYNLRMATREWSRRDPERSIFDMGIPEMLRDAKIEGLPQDDSGEQGVKWLIEQHRTISAESEKLQNQIEEGQKAVEQRDQLQTELEEVTAERDKLVEDGGLNADLVEGSKRLRKEKEELTGKVEMLEEARELSKTVEQERDELKARVEELDTEIEGLNEKIAENGELAKLGEEARTKLIDAAIEEGKRAGKVTDETEEATRENLGKMDIAGVTERFEFWGEVAKERFPGGQQSNKEPGDDGKQNDQSVRNVATVRQLHAFGIDVRQ